MLASCLLMLHLLSLKNVISDLNQTRGLLRQLHWPCYMVFISMQFYCILRFFLYPDEGDKKNYTGNEKDDTTHECQNIVIF